MCLGGEYMCLGGEYLQVPVMVRILQISDVTGCTETYL